MSLLPALSTRPQIRLPRGCGPGGPFLRREMGALWTRKGLAGSGAGWVDLDGRRAPLPPQNALPSDEDDKDPNDPYRALDIDLDK